MRIAEFFDKLRFLHPDKSVVIPTKEITLLRFLINSRKMPVKLTLQKEKNLERLVELPQFLQQSNMLPCTTEH